MEKSKLGYYKRARFPRVSVYSTVEGSLLVLNTERFMNRYRARIRPVRDKVSDKG